MSKHKLTAEQMDVIAQWKPFKVVCRELGITYEQGRRARQRVHERRRRAAVVKRVSKQEEVRL